MPTSTANAVWEGGLRTGNGQFSAQSGAFQGKYSFGTRFGGDPGTNPEELIAAAHAACISMALALGLEQAGTPPTRISTTAKCTVEKAGEGFKITRMKLEVRGQAPGVDAAAFSKAAEAARDGCPVSNALKGNVQIEVDARLA
jgi:osmotically inducible protein OsmC